jgi:hypothetical protein
MVKKQLVRPRARRSVKSRAVQPPAGIESGSPGIRQFKVDPVEPTFVRVISGSGSLADVRIDAPYSSIGGGIVIPPPGAALEAVHVDFDVVAHGPRRRQAKLAEAVVIEVVSGSRVYRETLLPTGGREEVRFNLLYREPGPKLFDCPRHGVVRRVKGGCPEPPPHTPIV